MNLVVCDTNLILDEAAMNWCELNLRQFEARSIFVPAGNTPITLYKQWEASRPVCLNGVELLQIDDVASGSGAGMFRRFFEDHLPGYMGQLRFIEDADRVADLAILGLGLNGHVAFHEPELPADFFSGCVKLSDVTCDNLKLERGTWGKTYGAGAFSRAKAILMIVKGANKREVVGRLLARDPSLPASALIDHPGFTLLVDRDAAPIASS